jgi:hypothetical protein
MDGRVKPGHDGVGVFPSGKVNLEATRSGSVQFPIAYSFASLIE